MKGKVVFEFLSIPYKKGYGFMEKRKTSIELMRFLAVVIVVLIHIRQILYPDNGMAEMLLLPWNFSLW